LKAHFFHRSARGSGDRLVLPPVENPFLAQAPRPAERILAAAADPIRLKQHPAREHAVRHKAGSPLPLDVPHRHADVVEPTQHGDIITVSRKPTSDPSTRGCRRNSIELRPPRTPPIPMVLLLEFKQPWLTVFFRQRREYWASGSLPFAAKDWIAPRDF